MDIITEKNYPIRGLWILKSIIGAKSILGVIFGLIILVPSYIFVWQGVLTNSGISYSNIMLYIVLVIVFALLNITIIVVRRSAFHYSVEDQFLTLRQGIFSRQQRHIPYGVIQNLFVQQDLGDRILGLASLAIENASRGGGVTAGGVASVLIAGNQRQELVGFAGNKVNIPGLKKEDAETLKEIILQKMKENPIEDNQSGL